MKLYQTFLFRYSVFLLKSFLSSNLTIEMNFNCGEKEKIDRSSESGEFYTCYTLDNKTCFFHKYVCIRRILLKF